MSGGGGDLAGYGARVGATLLDGLLLIPVAFVTAFVLVAADAPDLASGYVIIGVVGLWFLFYAPVLMCRSGERNGQTLGKQAVSIRVVRQDAQPMTASPAVLREFVGKWVLGLIPFYTIVDYLLPLGDPRREAIHDKLASTFVVRADAVPDLERFAMAASGMHELDSPSVPSGWTPPSTPEPPPAAASPSASADRTPPASPPPTPAAAKEPGSGEGFAAPADPPAPPTRPRDDDEVRGPFGPSSSDPR